MLTDQKNVCTLTTSKDYEHRPSSSNRRLLNIRLARNFYFVRRRVTRRGETMQNADSFVVSVAARVYARRATHRVIQRRRHERACALNRLLDATLHRVMIAAVALAAAAAVTTAAATVATAAAARCE